MEESVFWQIIEEKGEIKEARRILIKLASKRFGATTAQTEARLSDVSSLEKLEVMVDRVFDVKSWDELLQTA